MPGGPRDPWPAHQSICVQNVGSLWLLALGPELAACLMVAHCLAALGDLCPRATAGSVHVFVQAGSPWSSATARKPIGLQPPSHPIQYVPAQCALVKAEALLPSHSLAVRVGMMTRASLRPLHLGMLGNSASEAQVIGGWWDAHSCGGPRHAWERAWYPIAGAGQKGPAIRVGVHRGAGA